MSTVTTPNIDAPTLQQRGTRTTSARKTAVFVGLLFLTATAAFIFAEALNSRVLSQPNFLAAASSQTTMLATGALLLFAQFGVVGIAVLLFPLLETPRRGAGTRTRWLPGHRTCRDPVLSGGSPPGDRARSRTARRHGRWVCLVESWRAIAGTAPRGHLDDLYRHRCSGDLHGHTALPIEADPALARDPRPRHLPDLVGGKRSWTCSTWLT